MHIPLRGFVLPCQQLQLDLLGHASILHQLLPHELSPVGTPGYHQGEKNGGGGGGRTQEEGLRVGREKKGEIKINDEGIKMQVLC